MRSEEHTPKTMRRCLLLQQIIPDKRGEASSRPPCGNKGPRNRLSVHDRWARVVVRGVSLCLHDRLAHMVTNKGWLSVRNPRDCLSFWVVQSMFEYLKCDKIFQ